MVYLHQINHNHFKLNILKGTANVSTPYISSHLSESLLLNICKRLFILFSHFSILFTKIWTLSVLLLFSQVYNKDNLGVSTYFFCTQETGVKTGLRERPWHTFHVMLQLDEIHRSQRSFTVFRGGGHADQTNEQRENKVSHREEYNLIYYSREVGLLLKHLSSFIHCCGSDSHVLVGLHSLDCTIVARSSTSSQTQCLSQVVRVYRCYWKTLHQLYQKLLKVNTIHTSK